MTEPIGPDCARCGQPCVQTWFEVLPDFWVCFHCVTEDELAGWFTAGWESST